MTETKTKVFIGILVIIVLFAVAYNNVSLRQAIHDVSCSTPTYINNTYISPTNQYVYNYSTNNYVPIRTFQFSIRERHYCVNPKVELITGQSMLPLTDSRGEVLVDKVTWQNLKVGDAIVFRNKKGGNTFHAITYINENYAQTAGYNNDYLDADLVYPDDVLYRYCEPYQAVGNNYGG